MPQPLSMLAAQAHCPDAASTRSFAAIQGRATFPKVRCNAPEYSAVIGATGQVHPCFFISGPSHAKLGDGDLYGVLNGGDMGALRAAIRDNGRAECKTCVCSLWRDTDNIGSSLL